MQNDMNILKMIEGVDETGTPRAICNISIHKNVSEQDSKILETAFTMDAEVMICLTPAWVVVDLHFAELLDYDLFHMLQVCKNYAEMIKTDTNDNENDKTLILTITPAGEYDQFIIGRNAFWSLVSENLEDYCDTLRFIFMREQFGAYEFSTEAVEQMLDEISQEIEEVNI